MDYPIPIKDMTKRQIGYFVDGRRMACNCYKYDGFMIKWDCGSPLTSEVDGN